MAQVDELQQRVDDILSGHGEGWGVGVRATSRLEPPQRPFSTFVPEDLNRAVYFASRFMAFADRKPGAEGLTDAVADIERAEEKERPGLVQHAVKLFLTHHPGARESLRLQPLEERQPNLVRSSKAPNLLEEESLIHWNAQTSTNVHAASH